MTILTIYAFFRLAAGGNWEISQVMVEYGQEMMVF